MNYYYVPFNKKRYIKYCKINIREHSYYKRTKSFYILSNVKLYCKYCRSYHISYAKSIYLENTSSQWYCVSNIHNTSLSSITEILLSNSVFYSRVLLSYFCQYLISKISAHGNRGYHTETLSIFYNFDLYIRLVVTL